MTDLRKDFDRVFDDFVSKQGMIARRAISGKREEVWSEMQKLISPYYEDAMKWRNKPCSAEGCTCK